MAKTLLALALSSLALAGCASADKETTLTFIFTDAGGEQTSKTVSCPEDISCEAILSVPEQAWNAVPPSTPCTKIWGGPARLSVGGKIQGESIVSNFSLSGGCEINRWKEVEPLLEEVFGSEYKGSPFASV